MLLCFPGVKFEPFNSLAIDLYNISITNVDIPEPDTHVTQVNTPKGKSTEILLSEAGLQGIFLFDSGSTDVQKFFGAAEPDRQCILCQF